MITAVSLYKPVTMPVVKLTVAAAKVAPVIHVPPVIESVHVIEDPIQTVEGPEIAGGSGITVTIFDAVQLPTA